MDCPETNAVESKRFGLCGRLSSGGSGQAVNQLVAERPEIGSAGVGGVIAGAGGAGARMKVTGRGKILADQRRADGLAGIRRVRAVFFEQRSVGLYGEHDLA